MVPMEPASCQVLRDAGRLNDASPPENGEQYYDCGRDDSGSSSGSGSGSGDTTSNTTTSTTSTTSATSTPTPPPSTPEQPAEEKAAEAPSGESSGGSENVSPANGGSTIGGPGGDDKTINISCTKIDGVIGQWETLNCTMVASN